MSNVSWISTAHGIQEYRDVYGSYNAPSPNINRKIIINDETKLEISVMHNEATRTVLFDYQ